MNLRRRIKISWIALYVIRVRTRTLWLLARVLVIVGEFALARWKAGGRIAGLKHASDNLGVRIDLFCAEWQALSKCDREIRRQHFLATQSALLAENERIQAAALELKSINPIGAPLTYVLISVQTGLLSSQRKTRAFSKIVSEIETSPNFYCDLLLWFVLPGGYVEEQIGDLNEEFLLRSATDGESLAKAWYRRQVRLSIRARVWAKIERLVAIGTLVDFATRWFRR